MVENRTGLRTGVPSRSFPGVTALALSVALAQTTLAQVDPGVRSGAPPGGGPIVGLTPSQLTAFY